MSEPKNEDQVQMQIVAYLRSLGYTVFSVPNELAGKVRNGGGLAKMARMKAMGLQDGASDLVVVGNYPEIYFVEVKFEKGKQRASQKDFEKEILKKKHTYFLFRTLEECKQVFKTFKKN